MSGTKEKKKSLPKLLARSKWDDVRERVAQDPYAVADRTGTVDHGTVLSDAIYRRAPTDLVLTILRIYPKAARLRDDLRAHLPIQFACAVGASAKVFEALLLFYPESLQDTATGLRKAGVPADFCRWYKKFWHKPHKQEADAVLELMNRGVAYWKQRQAQAADKNQQEEEEHTVPAKEDPTGQPSFDSSSTTPPQDSSPKTALDILEKLNLSHLKDTFTEAEIETVDDLISLTMEDMKELNLSVGARNRLRKWTAAASTTSSSSTGPTPIPPPAATTSPRTDLRALQAKCAKHRFNLQDITNAAVTESALQAAEWCRSNAGSIRSCGEADCRSTWDALWITDELVQFLAAQCCSSLFQGAAREQGCSEKYIWAHVNAMDIVRRAMEELRVFYHTYSHAHGSRPGYYLTPVEAKELHEFRAAAGYVVCSLIVTEEVGRVMGSSSNSMPTTTTHSATSNTTATSGTTNNAQWQNMMNSFAASTQATNQEVEGVTSWMAHQTGQMDQELEGAMQFFANSNAEMDGHLQGAAHLMSTSGSNMQSQVNSFVQGSSGGGGEVNPFAAFGGDGSIFGGLGGFLGM